MNAADGLRITLELDPDSWHGSSSEGVWVRLVKALPPHRAIVEVDNIPFCAYGLSLGDKMLVVYKDGRVIFDSIVERGGHSTYRIFVEQENLGVSGLLDAIKALGCAQERMDFRGGKIYALDVPPEVDIQKVQQILDEGRDEGCWLCEEGNVEHVRSDLRSTPN